MTRLISALTTAALICLGAGGIVVAQSATDQPKPQQKFDPDRLRALIEKQSSPAPNATAMGPELATALTQMRARIMFLWKPPAGAQSPNALVVTVRIQLKPDGRVDGTPQVLTAGQGALFVATRDSAIKAVIGGQPYGMLPAAKYALWKDIEIVFDPRDLPR